jgi:hypothetical protein
LAFLPSSPSVVGESPPLVPFCVAADDDDDDFGDPTTPNPPPPTMPLNDRAKEMTPSSNLMEQMGLRSREKGFIV